MKRISQIIFALSASTFMMNSYTAPSHAANTFVLTSKTLHTGTPFPKNELGTSHGGRNESPDLSWTSISTAKSYAATIFDRDAQHGKGVFHWIVFNIPSSATRLVLDASRAHKLPQGAQEFSNFQGNTEYVGPTPPPGSGIHHYATTIYAVDEAHITAPADTHNLCEAQNTLIKQIQAHKLYSASIIPISNGGPAK